MLVWSRDAVCQWGDQDAGFVEWELWHAVRRGWDGVVWRVGCAWGVSGQLMSEFRAIQEFFWAWRGDGVGCCF